MVRGITPETTILSTSEYPSMDDHWQLETLNLPENTVIQVKSK